MHSIVTNSALSGTNVRAVGQVRNDEDMEPDPWPPPHVAPPGNLEPEELRAFICGDFEAVWDAIAARDDLDSRGNFLFGAAATIFVELCSRIAAGDSTGGLLHQFSDQLAKQEPRYFARLPGPVRYPGGFDLPHGTASPKRKQLLALVFDLTRNGLMHQYQQIPATLTDGKLLLVTLAGPAHGRDLSSVRHGGARRGAHLELREQEGAENLLLTVCPGALYMDVKSAASRAGLFAYGRTHGHLTRTEEGGSYGFSAAQLIKALG